MGMAKKCFRTLCQVILPVFLGSLLNAQSGQTNPITGPRGRYTLNLSSHWTAIPESVLDRLRSNIRGIPGADYEIGFWDTTTKDASWIVVAHAPMPDVPERKFADPDFLRKVLGAPQPDEHLAQLEKGTTLVESHYDESTHSVWMTLDTPSGDGPDLRLMSVFFHTSEGMLQIHCYSVASAFPAREPEFRSIIGSFKIADSIQYRPSFLERLLPDVSPRVRTRLVVGGTIGVLVCVTALIVSLSTRKSRRRQANAWAMASPTPYQPNPQSWPQAPVWTPPVNNPPYWPPPQR